MELTRETIEKQIAWLEGSHILIDNDMPPTFTRAELLAVYRMALSSSRAEGMELERDAKRYQAVREAAFMSHTFEQRAVRNVPEERAKFYASYDAAIDRVMKP